MSPPSDRHPCLGCFLQERRGGRVCPAAREVHALDNLEVQRDAEALHAAILRDAGTIPSLGELVRLEAHQYPLRLAAAFRLGLLAVPSADPVPDSRKEPSHVAVPRALR